MNRILPQLLADITRHPREEVEIIWSDKSWVHNIFRVYEMVFWRRKGIRAEARTLSYQKDGKQIIQRDFYTVEALLAYGETLIRQFLSRNFVWVELQQVQLLPASGLERVPYFSFAIALDVANNDTTSTSSPNTFSHTTTGTNPLIYVGSSTESVNTTLTTTDSCSYNSAALTKARTDSNTTGTASQSTIWLKGNPSTGANTVSTVFSAGFSPSQVAGAVTYSGAQQTDVADASNGTNGVGTGAKTVAVTTVADNCWVVTNLDESTGGGTMSSGDTARWTGVTLGSFHAAGGSDTNAVVTPAGSKTMTWTLSTANTNFAFSAASFAPAAAAGGSVYPRRMLMGVGN